MMRKVAVALLSSAYVIIALSAAALFWRAGAGWPVIATGFVGVLAFTFTLHNLVSRSLDSQLVHRELADLRAAHRILADNIESAHDVMETLTQSVQLEAAERTQAIVSEVRMLEDLVERMGETMQARLSTPHPVADPGRGERGERPDRQRALLLQTIRDALADGRVDLYLQPVVSLPQRRTAYYESFSRLRDDTGRVMMPAEYLAVAEPEGLMSAIDNLLLFRCVQIVRKLAKQDRKIGIFCNISLASLSDEDFFPQFLKFMAQNKDLAGALIFELGQKAFHDRSALESRNMGRLADLGFRFSVDKVVDIDLDFHDLARADVKFVKISAKVLLEELIEADDGVILKSMPDLHAADFAALSRRYGVEVIAEKVEAEREVIDVLELDIAYGQGHLFGEPRAIKEAVLAETAPPAELVRGQLRRSVGR
jgi:cyclic-di-GMP phosphodiesterase TipF (flagellum assembly factor)